MLSNNKKIPLNVVILGGSRGFGSSLVKEFHSHGHKVMFTSRNLACTRLNHKLTCPRLIGVQHDVSITHDFNALDAAIQHHMPTGIDLCINNAAVSDNYTLFHENDAQHIAQILNTNLVGSVLSTRWALDVFKRQQIQHRNSQNHQHHEKRHPTTKHTLGHIFNVAGAGSNGLATPQFSVYGATKAGIAQLVKSVKQELRKSQVSYAGLHMISPGMMPTDLLVHNATPAQLKLFNVLCEDPDAVAAYVYKHMLDIVEHQRPYADIQYMTLQRILYHLWTFKDRENRFFRILDPK